ncbi:NAD-dependent protein deacetylase [Chondromyces crocatus]|uniref:NAD-dependent protein deacetylase n=1 Tax=Chondromyces crocatus TaxID=52 RepID=A0A0K1EHD5_CHOCO|nr:NAD-dependent protein deacetylase [Chondromyces crocatus]AKT40275.1 NAD-dependent deacetylase [Chondromyces crocatus]
MQTPDLHDLVRLLSGRRVVALTGAGCSTESGIPDYRGPTSSQRTRAPIQYQEFVRNPAARQRYWARSFAGWPRFADAQPNPAHRALGSLERAGILQGLITQNVDRLHHRAGNRHIIELHGALAEVRCLDCGHLEHRDELQDRLVRLNPGWAASASTYQPDGDAEIEAAMIEGLVVPACIVCAGVLKPHVVFFGENVPRPTVEAAFAWVDAAEALLVAGSSLTVFSGFRFVRRAAERGIPVAIVNLGPTRGDPLAQLRVEGRLGELLPSLADQLTTRGGVMS